MLSQHPNLLTSGHELIRRVSNIEFWRWLALGLCSGWAKSYETRSWKSSCLITEVKQRTVWLVGWVTVSVSLRKTRQCVTPTTQEADDTLLHVQACTGELAHNGHCARCAESLITIVTSKFCVGDSCERFCVFTFCFLPLPLKFTCFYLCFW